jgi:hypothetical protein
MYGVYMEISGFLQGQEVWSSDINEQPLMNGAVWRTVSESTSS